MLHTVPHEGGGGGGGGGGQGQACAGSAAATSRTAMRSAAIVERAIRSNHRLAQKGGRPRWLDVCLLQDAGNGSVTTCCKTMMRVDLR